MKVVCPNKDKIGHEDAFFITTAHVTQEWRVDEEGSFEEVITECLEVTHKPDAGNIWVCDSCGAEAKVTGD